VGADAAGTPQFAESGIGCLPVRLQICAQKSTFGQSSIICGRCGGAFSLARPSRC